MESAGNYLARWIARAEEKRAWALAHPEEAAAEAARLEAESREMELREALRRRELRAMTCGAELRRMGVPRNISEEIQADELRDLHGEPRRWRTRAMEQARRWLAGDRCFLLFIGGTGSGKSAAAAWTLLRAGDSERGAFVRATEMARMSRFDDGIEWEHLLRVPWLVLDDLGNETRTEYFAERFFELIDTRQGMRRRTVLSANITAEEFKRRYGSRVASRLRPDVQVSNAGDVDLRNQQPETDAG